MILIALLSSLLFSSNLDINNTALSYFIFNIITTNKIESEVDNTKTIITMNDKDISIEFDYVGINNIYGISSISYKNNGVRQEFKSSSDWIGPYIVKDNSANDAVPRFTGGWHGSNGDTTGRATGKTINVNVYRNDYLVSIAVTNLIKAYNSDEYVIQEVISYTITDNTINVDTKITALKEISIERYYGLQTQNKIWRNNVKSINNNEFLLYSDGNIKSLRTRLKNLGLGNFNYVSDDLPRHFTTDYGKSYFNLINGVVLLLQKDNKVYWGGEYVFE